MGPFGTSATNWPIVPAPGDYEDGEFGGMMIGRGSRSTRRKRVPRDLTWREPGSPRWEASDYSLEVWHGHAVCYVRYCFKNESFIVASSDNFVNFFYVLWILLSHVRAW
jgi:hypothetical protein